MWQVISSAATNLATTAKIKGKQLKSKIFHQKIKDFENGTGIASIETKHY